MADRDARINRLRPDSAAVGPVLSIINRQRAIRLDLMRVRSAIVRSLPFCLSSPGDDAPQLLSSLQEVAISLVSERVMARVHREFLNIDGPTDVITFPYGEILICPAVAAENAAKYAVSVDREVVLYAIHGLLHLNGYDDISTDSARRMRSKQANILKVAALWA
jgi:probable rRNA maturation factor